ncbi:MAG: hypothetical protein JSW08_01170 [archaeon]|nr:MAG: hypothetical protein JSW08_01170 [archaeon]
MNGGWFYGGGAFEQLIIQWSQMGIFTVLLPFILVFAVVFAILEKVQLLQNKAVHVIIALAIGLFTISNPYAVSFFAPIFSSLGLGVAILVCLIIVLGLAIKPDGKTWKTLFTIVGILIFIIVIAKSELLSFIGPTIYCGPQCQALIIFVVVIALAIIAALVWGKKEKSKKEKAIEAAMEAQMGG